MQDNDNIYYLLEFCRGGDLGSLLCKYGSLNWAASQFFVTEILLAVHFLHLRQVPHRAGLVVMNNPKMNNFIPHLSRNPFVSPQTQTCLRV